MSRELEEVFTLALTDDLGALRDAVMALDKDNVIRLKRTAFNLREIADLVYEFRGYDNGE